MTFNATALQEKSSPKISQIKPFEAIDTVIQRYFETLNHGEFDQTAALFAENGVLYPPFEDGIVGQAAIAQYLHTEARSMTLIPERFQAISVTETVRQVEVFGVVKLPLFRVQVGWCFMIDDQLGICSVGIKLFASLQELWTMQQQYQH